VGEGKESSGKGRGDEHTRTTEVDPAKVVHETGMAFSVGSKAHPHEVAESGSSCGPPSFGESTKVDVPAVRGPSCGQVAPLSSRRPHHSWPCRAAPGAASSSRRARFPATTPSQPLRAASPHLPAFPSKNALSSGSLSSESTPGDNVVASVGNGLPPPLLVPPSWFRTTSTVSSSPKLRVCCNTLPTIGFAGFWPVSRPPPRAVSTLRSLPSAGSGLDVTTTLTCRVHRRGIPSRPSEPQNPDDAVADSA